MTFEEEVERRRLDTLAKVERIPIAVLLWGPSVTSDTPQAQTRLLLREALTLRGHLARFSEDLIDPSCGHSLVIQQVAQAESHDIVISVPGTPGSIAEIHDFARVPGIAPKIVTFLDNDWSSGYSNQSLIQLQSLATCRVQLYHARDLPGCIINASLDLISRLQEFYYLMGRRV